MENNINQQIDNEFEQMKAEISQQVMTELASQNITVIPNDYQPGHELVNIINEYNSKMKQLNEQIEYNTETYKQAKADVENYQIQLDKQDLKRETEDKLDNILAKQQLEIFIEKVQAVATCVEKHFQDVNGDWIKEVLVVRCATARHFKSRLSKLSIRSAYWSSLCKRAMPSCGTIARG